MPPWTLHRGFFDGSLDTAQNQLARGTTLARCRLVQPAVQVARNVDAGADRGRIHKSIIVETT